MNILFVVLLTLVGAAGLATVRTRDPVRQAIVVGILSLLLSLLFFVLQAPDVALSELVVGAAGVPLMLLLAIGRIAAQQDAAEADDEPEEPQR
jgi:energy-converting hydrogenase B subunit D